MERIPVNKKLNRSDPPKHISPIAFSLFANLDIFSRCRSGGCPAIGDSAVTLIALLAMMSSMSCASSRWVIIVVANMEAKSSRIDFAVTPEKKSTEDGFSQDIEDAVEDGFRVWSDDVATLAEAPSDGIQEPEEDSPNAADEVGPGDVGAKTYSVLASGEGDSPRDPEEGDAAKDVVAPLGYISMRMMHKNGDTRHTL